MNKIYKIFVDTVVNSPAGSLNWLFMYLSASNIHLEHTQKRLCSGRQRDSIQSFDALQFDQIEIMQDLVNAKIHNHKIMYITHVNLHFLKTFNHNETLFTS